MRADGPIRLTHRVYTSPEALGYLGVACTGSTEGTGVGSRSVPKDARVSTRFRNESFRPAVRERGDEMGQLVISLAIRLKARHGRCIGGRTRRISRLADTTALHQHVILAGQGHRTQGNHQKQVWYVGLRAFTVDHVAFLRSETTTDERDSAGFVHRSRELFTSRVFAANDPPVSEYAADITWRATLCAVCLRNYSDKNSTFEFLFRQKWRKNLRSISLRSATAVTRGSTATSVCGN